jgi:polyhydroxyalkanoate synthesis regulator phasin
MAGRKQPDPDAGPPGRAGRADAVRHAVDQAFKGTAEQGAAAAETGRERAQDIVDQLAQAAGRARDVLEDLRPRVATGEDVRALRESLEALDRRVSALEKQVAGPRRAPQRKSAGGKGGSGSGRKS